MRSDRVGTGILPVHPAAPHRRALGARCAFLLNAGTAELDSRGLGAAFGRNQENRSTVTR
jgi:hypothetical protein